MPILQNVSRFFLLTVSALALCMSVASDVRAETVFDNSNTGALYDVTLSSGILSPYVWTMQTTPTSTFPTDKFYILPKAVNKMQVQTTEGDCDYENTYLGTRGGNVATNGQVVSGVDLGNGICEFSLQGTVATGTQIGWIPFCKSNGCNDSNGQGTLKGSITNIGTMYTGGSVKYGGSIAFKLCYDSCDVGGFNSVPQIAPSLNATTSYTSRITNLNIDSPVEAQPESQVYESITGVSNPGTFQNTNLTRSGGAMSASVEGKYLTMVSINARTNGTQSNVLLTVYIDGTPERTVVVPVTTQSTAIWTDFVLSSPLYVPEGSVLSMRPTLDSGDNGYPYGESGGTGSWNIRLTAYEEVAQPNFARVSAQWVLNQAEIIRTVSEKNPTGVSFSISRRPSATSSTQGIAITNTATSGTSIAEFDNLSDGTYDILAKFTNAGCATGLSACPFPLAYVYAEFQIASGTLVYSSTSNEIYDNLIPPPSVTQYEDCGITNISGCISNSFRFLFIPSGESIDQVLDLRSNLETTIPFSYALDIPEVIDNLTTTNQNQSPTIELDLGFGVLTLFSIEMVEDFEYSDEIRLLLSYMLWLLFAFAMYRIGLNMFSHHKTDI